jgi:apolipoprotein N-acyltransferase
VPTRLLTALVAGAALAVSFEPARLVFLLPVAVAAFIWSVRGQSPRRAALIGAAFGAAFMHVLIFWMRVVGYDAWLALSWFMTLYYVGLAVGLAAVSRLRLWPLWSGLVWLAVEVIRGSWPMGGFTWGKVEFAVVDTPVERWLPWLGANGTGLLVVWASALLLWCALEVRERPRVAAGALAGAIGVLVVPLALPTAEADDGTLDVAIVQGNVPGRGDQLLAHHEEVTRSQIELTEQLAADVDAGRQRAPDFVVWPENSTAVDPFEDDEVREGILGAAARVGRPVLVGAMVDAPADDQVLNQGVVVDPVRGPGDRYTKRHPVPFGEYIPYRDTIFTSNFGKLEMIPRDMLSGTRTSPLRIDGTRIADAICFDVAYDDAIGEQVRGGAELLVVQTSNALFIHTGQIEQQFQITRMRALETGRYVVIAAVNGRSGVIGPDGDVVATIPTRTRTVLVSEVGLSTDVTWGVRLGPWIGRVAVITSLVLLMVTALPYRGLVRRRAPAATRSDGKGTA